MLKSKILWMLTAGLLLVSCQQVQVPEHYKQLQTIPKIYPDYTGVTIPVNMLVLRGPIEKKEGLAYE